MKPLLQGKTNCTGNLERDEGRRRGGEELSLAGKEMLYSTTGPSSFPDLDLKYLFFRVSVHKLDSVSWCSSSKIISVISV